MSLLTNLIAYWKFDESSGNASDATGGGITLTNYGTTAYASGKINNGADFGNPNTTKYFSTTNTLGIDGGAISYSFWMKPAALSPIGDDYRLFEQINTASTKTAYRFICKDTSGTRKIVFNRLRMNVANNDIDYNITMTTGTWYHIAYTYDGTTMRGYVNGVEVGNTTGSGNGNLATGYTAGTHVGADNGGSGQAFDGMMDELGVWSRALSAGEVSLLYNGGSGLPYANFAQSPSASPSSSLSPSSSNSPSNSPSLSPSSSNSPSLSPSSSNSPSKSPSSSNSPSLSPSSSNSPSLSPSSSNSPSRSPSSSNSPSASSSNSPSLSPSSSNSPSVSAPATNWWNASSLTLTKGAIVSGTLADTYLEHDSTNLVLSEITGAYVNPTTGGGFTYDFEFGQYDDVPAGSIEIELRGFYNGNPAHNIKLQQWNYTSSAWENITANANDFPSRSTEATYVFHIANDADHKVSGNVKFRIIHTSAGVPTHQFNINKLYLEYTGSPSSSASSSESSSASSSLSPSSSNSPSLSPSSSNSPSLSPSSSQSPSASSSNSPSLSPSSSNSPSTSSSNSPSLSPSSSESPSLSPSSSISPSLSPSSSSSPSLSPSSSASPSAPPTRLKYWNGSSWVLKEIQYYNGSLFVTKPLKYWDGSTWQS